MDGQVDERMVGGWTGEEKDYRQRGRGMDGWIEEQVDGRVVDV